MDRESCRSGEGGRDAAERKANEETAQWNAFMSRHLLERPLVKHFPAQKERPAELVDLQTPVHCLSTPHTNMIQILFCMYV